MAKFKATSGLENPKAESYIFDLSAIHYSTDARNLYVTDCYLGGVNVIRHEQKDPDVFVTAICPNLVEEQINLPNTWRGCRTSQT